MRKYAFAVVSLALLFAACGDTADDSGTAVSVETTAGETDTTTTMPAVGDTTATPATTSAPEETTTTSTTTTTEPPTGSGDDRDVLVAAIAKTGEFTSAKAEGWITVVGGEGTPTTSEATMRFTGEYDTTIPASRAFMDFSELAPGMPGSKTLSPERADSIGEFEVRAIGDLAYMRIDLMATLGMPTKWVSMTSAEAGDIASGFGANTADPMGTLPIYYHADAYVEVIGQESIRGINSTHFRITADVDKLLALADPAQAEELRNTYGFPVNGLLPVDMWIGDNGFVTRFAYAVDGTLNPEAGFVSLELVWEIYDYGEPITVEAPPANQVTDGDLLISLASGF